MKKKVQRNKKGGTEIFEIVVSMFIITFVLFYPVANYNVIQKRNLLEDTKTLALQMVSTRGGITTEVLNTIYADAEAKGLPVKDSKGNYVMKVYLYNSKTSSDGVQGVTPVSQYVYKTDINPSFHIKITYPATNDMNLLTSINKLIGINSGSSGTKYEYKVEGYMLSEKVQF